MTSDQERLAGYVAAWKSSADDVVTLLRSLDESDWSRPTDLPGWDVKGVACHLAHIEAELSAAHGTRVEPTEVGAKNLSAQYTAQGLATRSGRTGAEVIAELEESAARRHAELLAGPPTDGKADPPRTPGGIGWDWETLLINRVIDVWMHEQDIRRAVGRPGGLTTPGADHTIAAFARSFGYAVGKRVAPPAGTTVVLDVAGAKPVHLAVEVDADGRAVPCTRAVPEPTVALSMGPEEFIILAGGRRPASEVPVEVSGDVELGARVLGSLAVTP